MLTMFTSSKLGREDPWKSDSKSISEKSFVFQFEHWYYKYGVYKCSKIQQSSSRGQFSTP